MNRKAHIFYKSPNISHTNSDTIQNPSLNISNYYLVHNITVTSNYSISNENLIAFQRNITIFDYGKLVITNSCTEHTNFSINILVNRGTLNINNSSIASDGMIKATNSNLTFNNLTIKNNSNMIFNLNHDKARFYNSNIRFYSNPIKHVCFTSGKLFGKSYPYDTYGNIPLKETDIYNKSLAGNLSLHLYIRGDNNGTGELELYEFGGFIKNVSLPVHTGYYNYTDILDNSSILEFTKTNTKMPEYTLIIKSPEPDWNVVLNGTNISENGKVATFTLEKGHYLLTMYKAGYTKETYNVTLSDNMTLYISMHKIYHSNRVPYIMYISISAVIVGSVIGIFAYSKRTITCKNCGTRHYATFDKCPVCLTPVKHWINDKKKNR